MTQPYASTLCPQCGKEVESAWSRCLYCGFDLTAKKEPPAAASADATIVEPPVQSFPGASEGIPPTPPVEPASSTPKLQAVQPPASGSVPPAPPPDAARRAPTGPRPQQPQAHATAQPAKRSGMPVWGWILIVVGIMGCCLVAVIAGIIIYLNTISKTSQPMIPDVFISPTEVYGDMGGDEQPTYVPDNPDFPDNPVATADIPADGEPNLPAGDPLIIETTWFAQDPDSPTLAYYAFIVKNPNTNIALKEAEFQAVAYNSTGTILATSEQYVYAILPGEELGVSAYSTLSVPEGSKVEKVEIKIIDGGTPVDVDFFGAPFVASKVNYFPDQYSPTVTGIIQNPHEDAVFNVNVSAIAFNANGEIVGTGSGSYINYLAPKGEAPISMWLEIAGDVDHVQLYPSLSSGTSVPETTITDLPVVQNTGFSQDDYGYVNFAGIVQNPSSSQVFQYLSYQVGAYDEDGTVLGVSSGSIYLIFPGEIQAIYGSCSVPTGKTVARMEVQIIPPYDLYDSMGIGAAGITSNPLSVEQVTLLWDEYSAKVTGLVINSWSQSVQATVTAVAYDESGAIIGGGTGYVTAVPSDNSAAMEIYLYLKQKPARVEVYPTVSSLQP